MPKINIINQSDDVIEFVIETSTRMANAIRRYAMARVPVFAIHKVTFYENRTAFFDEYIAHRLGLIPIKDNGYTGKEQIGCFIDSIGPRTVYSEDISFTNNKFSVAIKGIPIITLADGQSLRLEGTLEKGIGRTHMKYQASITSYKLVDENKYQFFIETIGQMTAKEVLINALNEMEKDIESLEKSLEKL